MSANASLPKYLSFSLTLIIAIIRYLRRRGPLFQSTVSLGKEESSLLSLYVYSCRRVSNIRYSNGEGRIYVVYQLEMHVQLHDFPVGTKHLFDGVDTKQV